MDLILICLICNLWTLNLHFHFWQVLNSSNLLWLSAVLLICLDLLKVRFPVQVLFLFLVQAFLSKFNKSTCPLRPFLSKLSHFIRHQSYFHCYFPHLHLGHRLFRFDHRMNPNLKNHTTNPFLPESLLWHHQTITTPLLTQDPSL